MRTLLICFAWTSDCLQVSVVLQFFVVAIMRTNIMNMDFEQYLQPTFFLDFHTRVIKDFAQDTCVECTSDTMKAIALYYAVRDQIMYDPFDLKYSRTAMKASTILEKGRGYCVSKALLLAAVGRQQGIPCRIGFADVTNHLSSPKLREKMGTDLFVYHGYTDMYLEGKWVKATPAFNLSLCTRFNVCPLEFDGTEDSIFHENNTLGQKHMEYVKEHGHFADLPFEEIFAAYRQMYPKFFEEMSDDTISKTTTGFSPEV
jgi:transglutaminase-like putative cysteine protease